jgi:hypothetical protein
MTRYEEVCEAHFAWVPRQLAIATIFRELPEKMKQALTDYLQVPSTPARMPSQLAGRAIPYVELYRQGVDRNGHKTWKPCPIGEYFRVDGDGIHHFTIGICVEPQSASTLSPMMQYLEFTIESVDEQSAELQFAKTGRKIPIDLRNPTGYLDAAALVITYLLESMKGSSAQLSPIGF